MIKYKTIIILGGTDGIGRQLAQDLVGSNQVIIVGRNKERGHNFEKENGANAHFMQADLSLLANVKNLASAISTQYQEIDYVIHTADMLSTKATVTSEGQPASIVVNYYSRVLFNHLMLNESKFSVERIIHVALAGFNPGKNFKKKFPANENSSGFAIHSLGQASNDFYGLTMAKKLEGSATKINILNPGMVNTNIRKKGKVPRIIKVLGSVFEVILAPLMTKVEDYAKIVLAIINNKNEFADQYVLINRKGKGIKANKHLANEELQQYVWNATWKIIKGTDKSDLKDSRTISEYYK